MPRPEGAGRKKGTPNKRTLDLRAMVEAETEGMPLPVVLVRWGIRAMRNGDTQAAITAVSQAAKYVYPSLKAIEHTGADGKPLPVLSITIEGEKPKAAP